MIARERIALALKNAGANGLTVAQIEALLYGDREDGGPEDTRNNIRVFMYQLRQAGFPLERVITYRVKPRR